MNLKSKQEPHSIFTTQWFKEIENRINQLEKLWKEDIVQFHHSFIMEEIKAAQLLQVSLKTFRRYCNQQYFTVYRIGKRNFILQHDLIRGILTHFAKII